MKTLKDKRKEIKDEIDSLPEEIKADIADIKADIEEKKEEIKQNRGRVRSYFQSLFNITDNMMSYEEIDAMMREQTVIHGANMWILMLAIFIASIGLNMNSTAVIIGAMLISPLMSGILSMGYSVAVRDLKLLKRAFVRFMTQVVISLVAATMYFSISPMTTPTQEMIARTSPTLWDVLIALFGGLAGMIGQTRKKTSNVIPGVAIATALMPPLCTAGYGIATAKLHFFFGAFYLFIINTLFIAISTAIITLVLGVPYHRSISEKSQKRVNLAIVIIAIVAVIPSVIIGAKTVLNSYTEQNINKYLEKEFNFTDTQIVKTDYNLDKKTLSVSLVGTTIEPDVIAMLEEQLKDYGLSDFTLRVTQNIFVMDEDDETVDTDKVTIVVQENKITELTNNLKEKDEKIEELKALVAENELVVNEYDNMKTLATKAEKIYSHLAGCKVGVLFRDNKEIVVLTATASEELEEYEMTSIKEWLKAESGKRYAEVFIQVVLPEE